MLRLRQEREIVMRKASQSSGLVVVEPPLMSIPSSREKALACDKNSPNLKPITRLIKWSGMKMRRGSSSRSSDAIKRAENLFTIARDQRPYYLSADVISIKEQTSLSLPLSGMAISIILNFLRTNHFMSQHNLQFLYLQHLSHILQESHTPLNSSGLDFPSRLMPGENANNDMIRGWSGINSSREEPWFHEEEHDSLWVGVRRHGQTNWEAILRDSALKFSWSKTPLDLSLRWNRERLKILNSIYEPGRKAIGFQTPTTQRQPHIDWSQLSVTSTGDATDTMPLHRSPVTREESKGFRLGFPSSKNQTHLGGQERGKPQLLLGGSLLLNDVGMDREESSDSSNTD